MINSINRRNFIRMTTVAGGAAMVQPLGNPWLMAAEPDGIPQLPPVRIHRVYLGRENDYWPGRTLDLRAEIAKYETHLAQAERRLGDVKFVGGELVREPDKEAPAILQKLGDADAVLVIALTGGPNKKPFVDAGKPTVVFAQPFSGHDWMFVPQWQKAGQKVVMFATGDYSEVTRAAALLRVPARMRQSRVLLIGKAQGTSPACSAEKVKQRLGTDVRSISVEDVVKAHGSIDSRNAEAEAKSYWLRPARKVLEPSHAEIVKATRMYLAMKKLLAPKPSPSTASAAFPSRRWAIPAWAIAG